MIKCEVCGAAFRDSQALGGHKGGRKGLCGMSVFDTMNKALWTLLDSAVLRGKDEYYISTADYDAAREALLHG